RYFGSFRDNIVSICNPIRVPEHTSSGDAFAFPEDRAQKAQVLLLHASYLHTRIFAFVILTFTWGLCLWGQLRGAPSQLKSKPIVPAGSYTAVMLVSSLVQVMPGCDNRSTRLGTWLMDQLLSLTSDCSHHDGPACWALSDPSHLTRPYPHLWTDFPASNLTCLITTNNLDAWLNLYTRCCSASHGIALGSWPHSRAGLAEHFLGYLVQIRSCESTTTEVKKNPSSVGISALWLCNNSFRNHHSSRITPTCAAFFALTTLTKRKTTFKSSWEYYRLHELSSQHNSQFLKVGSKEISTYVPTRAHPRKQPHTLVGCQSLQHCQGIFPPGSSGSSDRTNSGAANFHSPLRFFPKALTCRKH
ncbi:hypothetical protein EK904_001669, partial [Melospiza melodia maxima]